MFFLSMMVFPYLQFIERTIVDSGEGSGEASTSPLNLLMIVGLALVISMLAKVFADKGRRK